MNILVVVAHPDDEVLGCGGTIAKHHQKGDLVHTLILAEGATSRDETRNREKRQTELSELAQAAQKAGEVLGINSLKLADFPDNRLDGCELLDLIKVVEQAISQYHPTIIYTHHGGDLNVDHQKVHQAVVTASRPLPNSMVKTLLFFEVPSSTEWQSPSCSTAFVPNWFVDITETLPLKLKALKAYQPEMRPYPHPRSLNSVEYLAKWRGTIIGVEAAEAFMLGRQIT